MAKDKQQKKKEAAAGKAAGAARKIATGKVKGTHHNAGKDGVVKPSDKHEHGQKVVKTIAKRKGFYGKGKKK